MTKQATTTAKSTLREVTTAEELAAQVLAGEYKPADLTECQSILPTDKYPQLIEFIQHILFAAPLHPKGPNPSSRLTTAKYLILQPHEVAGLNEADLLDDVVTPLADRLLAILDRKHHHGKPSIKDVRLVLQSFLDARLISRAPFREQDPRKAFVAALSEIFIPRPFQIDRTRWPLFAICAVYEQAWEHCGYTRGELITSLSLAPGEQLTLEVHSWDKTTIKTEEELAVESEMRSKTTLTERDSSKVVREMTSKVGGSHSGGFAVKLPAVSFGGKSSVSAEITKSVSRTTEHTRERTAEASDTLKNSHKTRIEVSRDIGREQKQTRLITNTNRCHTLNCYYFEVISNYLVTTRLKRLEPCILVLMPKPRISFSWILCHEAVLREVLLSTIYLGGFEAARLLETCRLYREDVECGRPSGVHPPIQLPPGVAWEFAKIPKAYLANIYGITDGLLDTWFEGVEPEFPEGDDYLEEWAGLADLLAAVTWIDKPQMETVLGWAHLFGDPLIRAGLRGIDEVKDDQESALQAVGRLLSSVPLSRFESAGMTEERLVAGLTALGVSPNLFDRLRSWGLLDLRMDDGGIELAVRHIASYSTEAIRSPVALTQSGVSSLQGRSEESPFTPLELASARVSFNQLACHIRHNWPHYNHAIWARMHADKRLQYLEDYSPYVARIVRNEIVGFHNDRIAFPIADPTVLDDWAVTKFESTLTALLDSVLEEEKKNVPVAQLIAQPVYGEVLEAVIGECDACEEYIQRSRVLDLQTQKAKAEQEEAEAQRQKMRLEQDPPVLDDPSPSSGQLTISVVPSPPTPPT